MVMYEHTFTTVIKASYAPPSDKFDPFPDLLSDIYTHMIQDYIPELIAKLYAEHGIETLDWNVINCNPHYVEENGTKRIIIDFEYRIDTQQPLNESVLSPLLVKLILGIIAIISAALVAIYYAPYVMEAVESFYTEKFTIVTHDGNPESPNFCTTTTESHQKPDIPAIGSLGIFAIIALIILLIFFIGMPKNR